MKSAHWGPLALAFTLTACGGGGSSSGGSNSSEPEVQRGIFTDSAVAGIRYQTAPSGQSGSTTELGEYEFVEGDSVTFSIGGITLPEVPASGRVTPADMDGGTPNQVTNILRLLQSLDDDGNPDNGITIDGEIHGLLADAQLNLGLPQSEFETQFDTEVAPPTGKSLVSADKAEAHFGRSQQADLRGSWLFVEPAGESSNGKGPNGEEVSVLTFLSGNRYIVSHKYGNDDQGTATAEWGYYEWNPADGVITFSAQAQSNTDGGFCETLGEGCGQETVRLVNDELHFGSEADAAAAFKSVKSSSNAFVGSWLIEDQADEFHVLTVLEDGSYNVAHSYRDEGDASLPADAPTSEWGNYSIDGKQFSVTDIVSETDGDGGLSDGDDVCTTTKWGDFNCESDAEEAFSFMRVGRFTVKLRVEDDNGSAIYRKTATVERSAERLFVENQSKAFTYAFPDEADKISVRLYENGSGRVDFGPDESSTIEHSWKVNAAGSLDYYETMDDDSTGYWLFAPIKDSRGRDMALISFSHKDGTTSHESAFFISELVGEVVAK